MLSIVSCVRRLVASSIALVIMERVCILASLLESLETGGKQGGNEGGGASERLDELEPASWPLKSSFRKVRKPGTLQVLSKYGRSGP